MKILTNSLQFGLIMILLTILASCSSDTTETADTDTTDVESTDKEPTEYDTRILTSKVSAKAYHYANLVTFKDGLPSENLEKFAALEDKKINLVVLYESDALWAKIFSTGRYDAAANETFNHLMASYDLKFVQQFAINEDNHGLVLAPNTFLENPVEAAREFSLVEHVLMVQIKEVPPSKENPTANPDIN